jgi:hypothetical protein
MKRRLRYGPLPSLLHSLLRHHHGKAASCSVWILIHEALVAEDYAVSLHLRKFSERRDSDRAIRQLCLPWSRM